MWYTSMDRVNAPRMMFFVLSILCLVPTFVHSFSTPTAAPIAFGGILDSIFGSDPAAQKRANLKASLLAECRQAKPSRERIESLISELAPLSPTQNAASSSRLQKKWILEWTTEKEINVFLDWGISGTISQRIDGLVLQNLIPFLRGGSFGVTGKLSIPDQGGIRTDFKFESATLDLGKWGSFTIPPVGEGWFDTVFLDDDFRVDTNSRDDILICTAEQ